MADKFKRTEPKTILQDVSITHGTSSMDKGHFEVGLSSVCLPSVKKMMVILLAYIKNLLKNRNINLDQRV